MENRKQRVKILSDLSPSPLSPMSMVPPTAALLAKLLTLVLVPPVLQVLSRVFQELILLFSLKQRAHNSHALVLHLVSGHPSSCRSFCAILSFETDLRLSLPLLIC